MGAHDRPVDLFVDLVRGRPGQAGEEAVKGMLEDVAEGVPMSAATFSRPRLLGRRRPAADRVRVGEEVAVTSAGGVRAWRRSNPLCTSSSS